MTAAKDQGPTSSDVERMRDALEPFAKAWNKLSERYKRVGSDWHEQMPADWPVHLERSYGLTVGDLRRAAVLLSLSRERGSAAGAAPLPSTAGWLPISTAPKDGTRILTKLDHPVTPVQIARWQHLEWRLDNNNWPCYPLGWQPLPPPSQEGASEGEGQT
jgi:hypothetical protein